MEILDEESTSESMSSDEEDSQITDMVSERVHLNEIEMAGNFNTFNHGQN